MISMGDLNTLPGDFPHPIKGILTHTKKETDDWKARDFMVDVHEEFMKRLYKVVTKEMKRAVPLGLISTLQSSAE